MKWVRQAIPFYLFMVEGDPRLVVLDPHRNLSVDSFLPTVDLQRSLVLVKETFHSRPRNGDLIFQYLIKRQPGVREMPVILRWRVVPLAKKALCSNVKPT